MALDFAERYEGKESEALEKSRAGRWFFENDMVGEFEFVGDVGASDLVPEVVEGRLRVVEDPRNGPPLEVSDAGG